MTKSEFGRHLRFLRQQADLTQRELAEAVGVSHNTVSAWERGDRLHHQPRRRLVAEMDRTLGAGGTLLEYAGYALDDQLPVDPEVDGLSEELAKWNQRVQKRLRDYESAAWVPPTRVQLSRLDTEDVCQTLARFSTELASRIPDDDPMSGVVHHVASSCQDLAASVGVDA